jgi:isopentenyl-diphosphate Delta-isomerase
MTMVDANELVVLVDTADRQIGTAPKLAVHRDGRLHRAISVQIADRRGRLLLQKRHIGKYHSGGLWTNTCCSHPRPGETVLAAAQRRLQAEMGIACALSPLFTTSYRADLDNGMIEHEIVHVFAGIYEGAIRPDPLEADGYDWVKPDALRADLSRNAERYSAWFSIYVRDHWPEVASLVPAGGSQLDDLEIA